MLLLAAMVFAQTGAIKGHVVDEIGDGINRSFVVALHADSATMANRQDGSYVLRGLPAGFDTLKFSAAGYSIVYQPVVVIADSEIVVDQVMMEASSWTDGDYHFPSDVLPRMETKRGHSSIIGKILPLIPRERLARPTYVVLWKDGIDERGNGYTTQLTYHGKITEDGTFVIDDVEPGCYSVVARRSGFYAETRKIRVEANQTIRLDFPLCWPGGRDTTQPASVLGRLWNQKSRAPFTGASATLFEKGGSTVQTDAFGMYCFQNVTRGTHLLKLSASGYATEWVSFNVENGMTNWVHESMLRPAWVPDPQLGTVKGHVFERDIYDPAMGAVVMLLDTSYKSHPGSSLKSYLRSHADIKNRGYILRDIKPGRYILRVDAVGYSRQEKEVIVAADSVSIENIQMR